MGIFFIYIMSFTLTVVYSANPRIDPLVSIEQGLVRGLLSANGKYSSFLGIPYAKVNLSNPFGPSIPHPGFGDTIFEALDGSTRCPQEDFLPVPSTSLSRSTDQTLDCLTLNIYVPTEASQHNPLPVLAHIHGGGFYAGSAGNEGVPNLVNHGIVVVHMNYRLGPYGFLCLDSPLAPGNQGLKDQYEALNWIRRNIRAFGGDSQDVTLGGRSAGGASAICHLYSNREKLYSKIIVQSGVPQVEGLFVKGNKNAALKLASKLGFTTNDTEEALAFLTKTPHELVSHAFVELSEMISPCKEKQFDGTENFITDDLYSFSNELKVRNTPVLIGHIDKEIFGPFGKVYGDSYVNNLIYKKLKNNFNFDDDTLTQLANVVRHFYIGDENESESVMAQLETFDSDFMFVYPTLQSVTSLQRQGAGPIYSYLFNYIRKSEPADVLHGYDKKFLFQTSDAVVLDDKDDRLISDRLTTLCANFINYGNPTPETTDLLPVIWQPIDANNRPYLVIDTDMRMANRVFNDRMAFWDLFFSSYGSHHILANNNDFSMEL